MCKGCEKGRIGGERPPGPAGSRAAAAATAASDIPPQTQTSALLAPLDPVSLCPPRRSRRHTPRPSRRLPSRRTPPPPRRPTWLLAVLAGPAPCVGVVGWGLVNECVNVVGWNQSGSKQAGTRDSRSVNRSRDPASQGGPAGKCGCVLCGLVVCSSAQGAPN